MIEYFLRLMDALEVLERSIFRINDLKREFEYEVNKLVNKQALFACLVLPVVLMGAYTIGGSGMVGGKAIESTSPGMAFIRMFGAGFIAWTLGVMLNITFKYLWYRDYLPSGKTAKQQQLLPKYEAKKEEIIQEVEEVVPEDVTEHSPIPDEYLNVPTIDMLMRYLQEGKVSNLSEALELYQQETKDTMASVAGSSTIDKFKKIKDEDFLVVATD